MTYNAIAQTDHEVASNASGSDASRSSSPHAGQSSHAFRPLALDLSNIGGSSFMEPAKPVEDFRIGPLASMIQSTTSAGYDMLEEDDYDAPQTPGEPKPKSSTGPRHRVDTPVESPRRSASPEQPVLRSPSSDHPVPLSHPTPDLQSLQGAYVGNVERLEKSAERLSMSSADLGSEIRKMDRQQKRRSCSSASNSIGTRSGAFSPPADVSSPRGSTRSGNRLRSASASRLTQLPEPDNEEDYDTPVHEAPVFPILPPPPAPVHDGSSAASNYDHFSTVDLGDGLERPATAASTDTYQQARILFNDFDGVHFDPNDNRIPDITRSVSLTKPPLASRAEPFKEPQVGQNMVYYPAPVPMMLNLPPRLSQKPASQPGKRQSEFFGSVPLENRKSAAFLPLGQEQEVIDNRRSKRLSKLPPQFRSSTFDRSAPSLNLEGKQASAVATLESILDASARAAVTAFTDHPYVGPVGAEVYGKAKTKPSSKNLAEQRKKHLSRSTIGLPHEAEEAHERSALCSSIDGQHVNHHRDDSEDSESDRDHSGEEGSSEEEEEGKREQEEEEEEYIGPPTTLLAELQLRKQELKQRRRTAAISTGMHSTLLQLDAVAQKQSENRRQRPVTLAWEDPDPQRQDEDSDEDVPLGLLYPDKNNQPDEVRPLGLLERKELEENEPLSRRRARLRGEPPPSPARRASTMPIDHESEDEGETLAQRVKRLKENRASTIVGSEFTHEVMAEINNRTGNDENEAKTAEAAPEEETLGQRRKRLQEEAKMKAPKARRSMADILQEYPVPIERSRRVSRQVTQEHPGLNARKPRPEPLLHVQEYPAASARQPGLRPLSSFHHSTMDLHQYANRMSTYQFPSNFGYPGPALPRQSQYGMPNAYAQGLPYSTNSFVYNNAMANFGHSMPNVYGAKVAGPAIDNGQREMIDRWRQSVMR